MGFLTNRHPEADSVGIGATAGQSRAQSLIISLGLLYLAIPNILFLWGWFTPWVAMVASAVLVLAVGRAVVVSFAGLNELPVEQRSPRRPFLMSLALLLALVVILFYILRLGVLGFVPSFIDHYVLRHAMFCNLRDAAWPLVLPNGKEMSYYLAGILPSALLARLFPATGQWAVVLWTCLGTLLSLLLLSSRLAGARRSWGWSMLLVTIFLGIICNPLASYNLGPRMLALFDSWSGWEFSSLCPGHRLSCSNPLNNCGILYHISPSAFLVASLMLICRHRVEVVLPVALALLVPISPFAGIGVLPLFLARWFSAIRARGGLKRPLFADLLLPAVMAFISAVYFTRANGESAVALAGMAWGWPEFFRYMAWQIAGWLFLLLPLLCVVRRDSFFFTLSLCCLLLPLIFVGSLPAAGLGQHNELLLKVYPCYLMLVGMYWLLAWQRIGWYKYAFLVFCVLAFIAQLLIYAILFSKATHAYMEVDDRWNGHLNHAAPFLNQSVPPCREPLVPGVMLREAGASERSYPGCLLPRAPGCDYSRPPEGTEVRVIAPL